jgi:hypothetical protein
MTSSHSQSQSRRSTVCFGGAKENIFIFISCGYVDVVAPFLYWRTGVSFTIAAGPHQRSHFRVRVSWRVSDSRLPQEQGGDSQDLKKLSNPPSCSGCIILRRDRWEIPFPAILNYDVTCSLPRKSVIARSITTAFSSGSAVPVFQLPCHNIKFALQYGVIFSIQFFVLR